MNNNITWMKTFSNGLEISYFYLPDTFVTRMGKQGGAVLFN